MRDPIKFKEELLAKIDQSLRELRELSQNPEVVTEDILKQIAELEQRRNKLLQEIYTSLTPWDKVQLARHPNRPLASDYISGILEDFTELHGDRASGEDPAIIAGIGFLNGVAVAVLGHQKGRSTKEKLHRNFGMPHPSGFRKAARIMRLAERMGWPVISFVDTPGAYPGIAAEEGGQYIAIAESILTMVSLRVPTIAVFIGEGGSGGALAIGIGNVNLMLENAYFSVISPEGCASIIYRDAKKAPLAAEKLKLDANSLLALRVIDEILPEPMGGAHKDPLLTIKTVKEAIERHLKELLKLTPDELIAQRAEKYHRLATFLEGEALKTHADLRGLAGARGEADEGGEPPQSGEQVLPKQT